MAVGATLLVFAVPLLVVPCRRSPRRSSRRRLPKIVSADVAATLCDALGVAMHTIFVMGLSMMPVVFVATVIIERRELRRSVHEQPVEPCAQSVRRCRRRVRG